MAEHGIIVDRQIGLALEQRKMQSCPHIDEYGLPLIEEVYEEIKVIMATQGLAKVYERKVPTLSVESGYRYVFLIGDIASAANRCFLHSVC